MKMIDENGKLFKKFNLVDAIVVLLVVVVIAALGWKMVSAGFAAAEERKEAALAEAYDTSPHLMFEVVCVDLPEVVAESFAKQMELPEEDRQIMNGGELVKAYITDFRYEPNEKDSLCTGYFTCEAALKEEEGIYSVGTQEIRIGKSYIVKTYEIETSGYISSMEVVGND